MSGKREELWSILPEKAHHPTREPMLEALWWIGEPLSAIDLVDVFDGFLTMWAQQSRAVAADAAASRQAVRPRRVDRAIVATRFGANLRRCRWQAGLSQEALGHRAALHRTAIGLLERGERGPGLDTILVLAKALEVAPAILIGEIE